MRTALIASIALHIVAIGVLFMNFGGGHTPEPALPPPVAVEMLTPAEFAERKAGKETAKAETPLPPKPAEVKAPEAPAAALKQSDAKPVDKPAPTQAAPPPPKRAEAPPPPKPVEPVKPPEPKPAKQDAKAEPKPAPKPEPKSARAAETRPARPEPKPEPEPEPAPHPVERTFDPDRIASLIRQREADAAARAAPRSDLDAAPSRNATDRPSAVINRDPNAGQLSAATEGRPWRPASSLDEQALGLPQAQGTQTALSCGDVVRARIEQNWDLPLSGVAADAGTVRIRIELNADGTLARAPAILEDGRTAGFQAVADAAVRAAIRAQPFPIPPAQFDRCRLMNLTFDPRDMYGG